MASPTRRKIQTALLVTLISGLIWIYAESQSVKEETDMRPIPISLPELAGDLVVTPLQDVREVEVRLMGPAAQLVDLRRAASTHGITLPLGELQFEPGLEQINVAEILEASDLFAGTGVSVVEASPYRLQFRVDELVSRKVPVVFRTDTFLSEPATVVPKEVDLKLPSAVWVDLTGRGVIIEAIAEVPTDMDEIPAGQPVTRKLPLRLPELLNDYQTRLNQQTADVSFTVKDARRSLEITEVPIWMQVSPRELAAYQIRFSEQNSLTDVRLVGPSDILDSIEKQEFTVIARVVLSYNTLLSFSGKGPSSLPVTFELVPTRLITGTGSTPLQPRGTSYWPDTLKIESKNQSVTVVVEEIQ